VASLASQHMAVKIWVASENTHNFAFKSRSKSKNNTQNDKQSLLVILE
jgi:hypothetical protein